MNKKILFEKILEEKDSVNLAKDVAKILIKELPFCLLLKGTLGAGKTSLVRQILYELGLPVTKKVKSPTFTYVCEYEIANKFFLHGDFYRIDGGDFSLEGYDKTYSGYFMEWPKDLNFVDTSIQPTHIMEISYLPDDINKRSYKMFAV